MNILLSKLETLLDTWNQLSQQEISLVNELKRVFTIIEAEKLLPLISSVYLFGSFARRELRPGSDIDVKIIIKDSKNLALFIDLKKRAAKITNNAIGIGVYSIEQLHNGKFRKEELKGANTPPDFFIKYLPTYLYLYGERLEQFNFPSVTDKDEITRLAKFVITLCDSHNSDVEKMRMVAKQSLFVFMIEDRIKRNGPLSHDRRLFSKTHKSDAFYQSVLKLQNHAETLSKEESLKIINSIKAKLSDIIAEFS